MKHKVAQFMKFKIYMDHDDENCPNPHVYVDFHGLRGTYDFKKKEWRFCELEGLDKWAVESFVEDYEPYFYENYNENAYAWINGD